MPYAAVVTVTPTVISAKRHYLVLVSETLARDTSEYSVPGIPQRGKIVSYRATLTAGTGTTIAPKIGTAAGFVASTQAHVATQSPAAIYINDQSELKYQVTTGTLYIRSTVNNVAMDHSISTEILILDGWE